jgi:hypothetical protein
MTGSKHRKLGASDRRPGVLVVAAAAAIAACASACDAGEPASPTNGLPVPTGTPPTPDGGPGDSGPAYAVCPDGMDASFGSILTKMFATQSCGVSMSACHSELGAVMAGSLDYSAEAGTVYEELLGDAGKGQPAKNVQGLATGLVRVVPGDASASYLYIKLTLTKTKDKQYGDGMPQLTPGSVCPEALEAVKAWIDDGAKQN